MQATEQQRVVSFPVSFAQHRLWLFDKLRPGAAVYNMPLTLHLRGAVSQRILERVLGELVQRHETLRTTFRMEGSATVQVVGLTATPNLRVVDLRRHQPKDRTRVLGELTSEESKRPFDLEVGPLFRCALFRLERAEYVLHLVMHHIISDAWSMETLAREMGILYSAFENGEPNPLPPLKIQYADWATWQRERLEGQRLDEEMAYWRRALEGMPMELDLPSDRPRPERLSYAGDLEYFSIEPELAEGARALARRQGCTLFMTLFAVFAALMGRYARQNRLLIGVPVTNRDGQDVEPIVGMFANTVVLRADLRGAPTAIELLHRVRAMVLETMPAHAEAPLEKVIEQIAPERSAGRHPLFQVLFSLQASADSRMRQQALSSRQAPATTRTSKFDLSLLLTDTGREIGAGWEYSTELFDRERLRRMSGHFRELLASFVACPHQPVDQAPCIDGSEERQIARWEIGKSAKREPGLVGTLFVERAVESPDAIALEIGDKKLTYRELHERADRLGRYLCAQGVGPETRVGLFVRRNENLVVATLGIVLAGGAFVPLDPKHPRERLAFIAADARLALVVTESELAAELPEGLQCVFVANDEDAVRSTPRMELDANNLAYVLYTSGTTGRPKGVAVPHGCVATVIAWALETFDPAARGRVLASTSFCFDLSIFELFVPLCSGGTVVLVENILALAASERPDVTLVNTVPSAMRELLNAWEPGMSLRAINLAGEPFDMNLEQRLHERFPKAALHNLYGPTETTVYSTHALLGTTANTSPPIGIPIAGTFVYVLDKHLMRTAIGVPGDLYIGGKGVARGYLDRPGMTAAAFLPDPFSKKPGSRMYKTGDLVCWRADGCLEYRGRSDHQVKLNGYRIELGEIEGTLRRHSQVLDVVVAMRHGDNGNTRLVAYVTPPGPTTRELDALVRQSLPAYMAPAKYVFLEELPRTSSGKIDRRSLPDPGPEQRAPARSPETKNEQVLCELFAEALEVSQCDRDTDFFAHGGHSLLAATVVGRFNELAGLSLPLDVLFQHSTPGRLAQFAATLPNANGPWKAAPRMSDREPGPLSLSQLGMWFHDRLRPSACLYNVPIVLEDNGGLSVEALQRGIDWLIKRHDALRMSFEPQISNPAQRLDANSCAVVAFHDLSDYAPEEAGIRARRIVERDARRPFDLGKAPLLRATLIRTSFQRQWIALVMHHLICDGWSIDIITRELTAACQAFSTGAEPAFRPPVAEYRDFILWERSLMASVLEERVAAVRELLAAAPALIELPNDRERPSEATFQGGIVSFRISERTAKNMRAWAAERRLTLHMSYLAVFAAMLRQYCEQDDIVIGIPMANRSRREWRDVVGLFTNTAPVRIRCGGELTFSGLAERVRTASLAAYEQECVPFHLLVQKLSPNRNLRHHPIFQVMFTFYESETDSSNASEPAATIGSAKFDLSLNVSGRGDSVFCVLEFATDLFERASIEQVARRYELLAEALVSNPDQPLDKVAPLDEWGAQWRRTSLARRACQNQTFAALETLDAPMQEGDGRNEINDEELRGKIAAIWKEVLGQSEFGIEQNFFEVGGHSLAAMCVAVRIAEDCGVEIPFQCIFNAPTIKALAAAVNQTRASPEDRSRDSAPALRPVGRSGPLPLSFAQERLWFLDQLAPGLPTYNVPFAIPLAGAVDIGALEKSIEALAMRHECLRARFLARADGPEQEFTPSVSPAVRLTDLSKVQPGRRNQEIERVMSVEANAIFNLATGPLIRTRLLRLSERDHLLLVTLHHIVADVQSVEIFKRDLHALYETERGGEPTPLPELLVQYGDYAVWQRQWLDGERLRRQLDYWVLKLRSAPKRLELPVDRPRDAKQNYTGRQLPLSFAEPVTLAIRRLAVEEEATSFMALLAIFAAVLRGWTGATDIVIGAPAVGRPRRELEQLIGFFTNTLPLRLDVAACSTFRELLRLVRATVLDAFANQDVPFERIVRELQPDRTLAQTPVFQVMFAFQPPETSGPRDRGRGASTLSASRNEQWQMATTAKFDLTLFLVDETPFHGAIEYRTQLFHEQTILGLAAEIRNVGNQVAENPDISLSNLSSKGNSVLAQLSAWNRTDCNLLGSELTAGELCLGTATAKPFATAISSCKEQWTYQQLAESASRTARRLRDRGVGPESRVALCLEPSAQLIATTLGIWLAGGACVPLDPAYPNTRVSFMLEDSGARWLVCEPQHAHFGRSVEVLDVNSIAEEPPNAALCEEKGFPDQLAYVIYTSGSTGHPKGVAISHRCLVNLVLWQQQKDPATEARRTLQFASPSFDVFFQEMVLCLATGGELVIPTPNVRRDPTLLMEFCRHREIERMFVPYVALRELAELGTRDAQGLHLCEVVTAGEQLQVTPSLRKWFSALPSCRLVNQYGPSETHVITEERLSAEPNAWPDLPPIGRPIANARTYILDPNLQPVARGVAGEIYLGGIGVARGYLGRPSVTAERFLPDPFSSVPGSRMYQSGDRGRWLPDGRIEFLGRSDGQVKIRGHRVEIAEVEAALAQLPGVQQSVVIAMDNSNGGKHLVGYVLPEEGKNLDTSRLLTLLREKLPEPFIPSSLIIVDHLPKTPTGKVDRRHVSAKQEPGEVRKPGNDIERAVAAVWREILAVEPTGLDENFFVAGGHSLTAARLCVRLRERLGVDVPVEAIFEHPTLGQLATVVKDRKIGERDPSTAVTMELLPRTGMPLPASFAQARLWFLDQGMPGNTAYNLTTAHAFSAALDIGALRRSVDALVSRHESLRTIFAEIDGQPAQIIQAETSASFEYIDASFLPPVDLQTEIRERVEDEQKRSFDLARGPLFHTTLVNLGGAGYVLLLSMHHIISDGLSLHILHRDLMAYYEVFERGGSVSLPPLPAQYADYAAWQRKHVSGLVGKKLLEHWRTHLAGVPTLLELPTDRPRAQKASLARRQSFVVKTQDVVALRKVAEQENATLFMTCLAAYLELIHRYTRQDEFLIGVPVGARDRVEWEQAVGLFVNTVVIRADMSGEPTFRELVRRARAESLRAFTHAELPFDKLVEEMQPARRLSGGALIQAAFGLSHSVDFQSRAGGQTSELTGDPTEPRHTGNGGSSKFELSLAMEESGGRVSGTIEYDAQLFDSQTISRMAEQFLALIETAAQAPDTPVADWSLMSAQDAKTLTSVWTKGPAAQGDFNLPDLARLHAQRAPTRNAVEAPDGALTYEAFCDRIGRLAKALRACGAGPEIRVGVCLPNTTWLPISFVSVLQAGGVYVPLDPSLPDERLNSLATDAQVSILVTDDLGAKRFGGGAARIVTPDASLDALGSLDVGPAGHPDQAAYLIYTSGSTGRPKGVVITHRGLATLIGAQRAALQLRCEDRVLKFAPISFDASIFEMTAAIAAGATLCLNTNENVLPGLGLAQVLRDQRITMLTIPPSALALLEPGDYPMLRLLVVAAEPCSADLVNVWAHGRRMINGYGPTEATVWTTYAVCQSDGRPPPIGRPIGNVQVRILDKQMRPVSAGIPGELYIAGPTISRGYHGLPGLTASSFVPDPFGEPGARMYRTGDMVRWRDRAEIDFLGRVDNQVKLRGVRIELGEVEAAMAALDGVALSAAAVREIHPGNPALVGYIVPRQNATVDIRALRKALQTRLPKQFIPSHIVTCADLPRTANGKLDRRALPNPSMEPLEAPIRPESGLEEAICRICSEVLKTAAGPTDNFFDLGGHSLLLTQALARIRERLGIEAPVRLMFEASTLGDFCQKIDGKDLVVTPCAIPRLPRKHIT